MVDDGSTAKAFDQSPCFQLGQMNYSECILRGIGPAATAVLVTNTGLSQTGLPVTEPVRAGMVKWIDLGSGNPEAKVDRRCDLLPVSPDLQDPDGCTPIEATDHHRIFARRWDTSQANVVA